MNVGNNTALPPDSPHLKSMYIMDNAYTYIYVCVCAYARGILLYTGKQL